MHTYIHAYMNTCTNTYIHTYIQTYIHTHTHIQTHILTYIHTYAHTYIHTYKHTHIHACTHTCNLSGMGVSRTSMLGHRTGLEEPLFFWPLNPKYYTTTDWFGPAFCYYAIQGRRCVLETPYGETIVLWLETPYRETTVILISWSKIL